jgi:hypothetical protein
VSRLRTLAEWAVILGIVAAVIAAGYYFLFAAAPATRSTGLADNGGFTQAPLAAPEQYTKSSGGWTFSLPSRYAYTLAGRVVGRHEYPAAMPEGIIPLDLAVVNGGVMQEDILPYFTFTMGSHTLEYSYDIPAWTGLTEEYIDEHVSNNHLVFLDPALESAGKQVPIGSCVIISGKLVDISGTTAGGSTYTMATSTVRNDAYPAGCEIVLVESLTPVAC